MTNVQVIEELYRTFREKDYVAFSRLCTRDIEWVQNAGFPGGAVRVGTDAVVEGVFKAFDTIWEAWAFRVDQYLDAGQTVVVIGEYGGRCRKTGKEFVSPAAHVYDLRDQQVWRFRQFTDTKLIWDALS